MNAAVVWGGADVYPSDISVEHSGVYLMWKNTVTMMHEVKKKYVMFRIVRAIIGCPV